MPEFKKCMSALFCSGPYRTPILGGVLSIPIGVWIDYGFTKILKHSVKEAAIANGTMAIVTGILHCGIEALFRKRDKDRMAYEETLNQFFMKELIVSVFVFMIAFAVETAVYMGTHHGEDLNEDTAIMGALLPLLRTLLRYIIFVLSTYCICPKAQECCTALFGTPKLKAQGYIELEGIAVNSPNTSATA